MVEHANDEAVSKARELAKAYLDGGMNPIEAAIALDGYRDALSMIPDAVLDVFLAISSETDAILLGESRKLWHPDVRAAQDLKHDRAQAWARPLVDKACS